MRAGKQHQAAGHVRRMHSSEDVGGLTIEAWDGDRFIARTVTDARGQFIFSFGEHVLQALFGDRAVSLTIKVVYRDEVLNEGKAWTPDSGRLIFEIDQDIIQPKPRLIQITPDWDSKHKLNLKSARHPLPHGTLGTIGRPVEVDGPDEFPQTLLRMPYSPHFARGVDPTTARLFRWDEEARTLRPVWNSGINSQLAFAWGKIRRPGIYVMVALPSDKLLRDALATMAYQRRCNDLDSESERAAVTRAALAPLVEPPLEAVEQLRQMVLKIETNTSIDLPQKDIKRGRGGFVEGVALPDDLSPTELRDRLRELDTPPGGLPEESLFYPPEIPGADLPAMGGLESTFLNGDVLRKIEALELWKWVDLHWWWPWLFSHDWWMYQANERHSGHAMGWSDIRSTNVNCMHLLPPTPVAGPVYTKPAIVDGKIYVGSIETGATGGTLYKIDLYTGHVDGRYETPILPATYGIRGVGGSPAVVDGFAYFTSIHGRVYCVDTSSMTTGTPQTPAVWITDLKHANWVQNQPLNNNAADSWSGPLVVNGNVYVGCGEGETSTAGGFVYCLDSATGQVKWLFCTNQFQNGVDNQPNVVPASLVSCCRSSAPN
jgi:hypothetical protein